MSSIYFYRINDYLNDITLRPVKFSFYSVYHYTKESFQSIIFEAIQKAKEEKYDLGAHIICPIDVEDLEKYLAEKKIFKIEYLIEAHTEECGRVTQKESIQVN